MQTTDCRCQEVGSDGTTNHKVRAAYKIINPFSGEHLFSCENHSNNYKIGGFEVKRNTKPNSFEFEAILDFLMSDSVGSDENPTELQNLQEIRRLTNVIKKIANAGRNTVLHNWTVDSFTGNNNQYTVKQTLINGRSLYNLQCDCASFRYENGLDKNGHCKHCREVVDGHYFDVSYGVGAIEAHRRLTDIAKDALVTL